ncbi:MAG: hypothetical protein O3B37_01900 [Proteobacteria bacterium]|nr:hypothetical protein [Pseudomonadota bacterium]
MAIHVLRTIVIVLGVLILAVFGAIIWTAFDDDGDSSAVSGGTNSGAAPDRLSLGLPSPACTIEQARSEGGRLTVITGGPANLPECRRVFVIQLSSGRIQAEIRP